MMSKRKFTLSLVTLVMILTLTVGLVQAQTDLPPIFKELPDPGQIPFRDEVNPQLVQPIGLDAGVVQPVSPINVNVYTPTPRFYFTRSFEVDRYRIEIMSGSTGQVITVTGAGTCDGWYCYLQPTTALKPYDYAGTGGVFAWRVQARNKDGSWQNFSTYNIFFVLSKGFNSTFDANKKGWIELRDTWSLTSKGFLKTLGSAPLTYPSVLHKDLVFNFDYSVTMKRKSSTFYNALIVWGYPNPLNTNGYWDDGIYFAYANGGVYYIYMYKDGSFSTIQSATTTSAIKKNDWNTLRVVGNSPYLDFWINGKYLGWTNLNTIGYVNDLGYLGITMAKDPAGGDALLVDKANSKSDVLRIQLDHDPAMELRSEPVDAVEPDLFPSLNFGDPTGTR